MPERYVLNYPATAHAQVIAELSKREGTVQGMDRGSELIEIHAEMPDGSMNDFVSWLAGATSNRGSIRRI